MLFYEIMLYVIKSALYLHVLSHIVMCAVYWRVFRTAVTQLMLRWLEEMNPMLFLVCLISENSKEVSGLFAFFN